MAYVANRGHADLSGVADNLAVPYRPIRIRSALPTAIKRASYDDRRGNSNERGYGHKWREYRRHFKELYPLCGNHPPEAPDTPDSICKARGWVEEMKVVDHIVPVNGNGDPRFYDPANHQALCQSCHNAKRQREARTHPRTSIG